MSTEIKKSKIYTKKGDLGKTSLVDGSIVDKFHLRVEAYGSIDELNSSIGVIRTHLTHAHDAHAHDALAHEVKILEKIQNDLFRIGSIIACSDLKVQSQLPTIDATYIQSIELEIDRLDAKLPALKNFILPGGTKLSAFTHMSRTICRRAERNVSLLQTTLIQTDELTQISLIYLNRLSDYLFVLARYFNFLDNVADVLWKMDPL